MKREQQIILAMRSAIANLDTDPAVVRTHMEKAHELFRGRLMKWPKDFAVLYQQMYAIYCAYTPKPAGHHRSSSVSIGYSSFPVKKWISDKEQPPKPTAEELVAQFDALIASWDAKRSAARSKTQA